jgi:hypothetical protein
MLIDSNVGMFVKDIIWEEYSFRPAFYGKYIEIYFVNMHFKVLTYINTTGRQQNKMQTLSCKQ